jgi:hypothetical protein
MIRQGFVERGAADLDYLEPGRAFQHPMPDLPTARLSR